RWCGYALRSNRWERIGRYSERGGIFLRPRQNQPGPGPRKLMTNTLHRHGSAESFTDDYIVFAIPARGINDTNAVEKQRRFLEIARKYQPVNMGDASHGAIFRPSKELNRSEEHTSELQSRFDIVC